VRPKGAGTRVCCLFVMPWNGPSFTHPPDGHENLLSSRRSGSFKASKTFPLSRVFLRAIFFFFPPELEEGAPLVDGLFCPGSFQA